MKDKQHWRERCEQAAFEQDPDKLLELVQEINNQLEEKEKRLRNFKPWDRRERADNASPERRIPVGPLSVEVGFCFCGVGPAQLLDFQFEQLLRCLF